MSVNENLKYVVDGVNQSLEKIKESLEANKEIIESINNQSSANNTVQDVVSTEDINTQSNNPQLTSVMFDKMFTTSKLILYIVLGLFVGLIVSGIVIYVVWGKDIQFLIPYVQPLVITTTGGYYVKSGYENKLKYNNTNTNQQ